MYAEVIGAIMDIVFIVFAVYGIIVLAKWHSVAVKTGIAVDELLEELKDGDTNG